MLDRLLDTFLSGYSGYFNYLQHEIFYPGYKNYFWWLIVLSVFVWILEIIFPWRKDQSVFRRDFWLDGFYMFFNFFLFSLIGYNAVSGVVSELFNSGLKHIGINNLVAIQIGSWPAWAQMITLFLVSDFLHWNIHRLLHHVPWLWEFHTSDEIDEGSYCMAGGKLLISQPQVTRLELRDAELAMLMSHEIAHAVLQHHYQEDQEIVYFLFLEFSRHVLSHFFSYQFQIASSFFLF